MNNNDVISKRIKEIRIENNLSQVKFAQMLSVSQDTVSLWETNKSIPNTEYVIEICKKFNVSADYLLGIVD